MWELNFPVYHYMYMISPLLDNGRLFCCLEAADVENALFAWYYVDYY